MNESMLPQNVKSYIMQFDTSETIILQDLDTDEWCYFDTVEALIHHLKRELADSWEVAR